MYVVVFNRDKGPSEWKIVGPFDTQANAGDYAKKMYRATKSLWVVHPITPATDDVSIRHSRYWGDQ